MWHNQLGYDRFRQTAHALIINLKGTTLPTLFVLQYFFSCCSLGSEGHNYLHSSVYNLHSVRQAVTERWTVRLLLLSVPLENEAPLILSPSPFFPPPPPFFFFFLKRQTERPCPRNSALKMGTNSLSALLPVLQGPSLNTAPSFSFF